MVNININDFNDFNEVLSAISNELPSFDLDEIFGASNPVVKNPSVIGGQSSVSSDTAEAVREVAPVVNSFVNSIGNRPGANPFAEDVRNGPNNFPTYTSPAGRFCRKCDAPSYAACAAAAFETCELGDLDQCFLEIRETNGKIDSVSSGCKSKVSCADLKAQNFRVDSAADSDASPVDQCKPNVPMAVGRFGRRIQLWVPI